ncbi:DUF1670 domain-containing protein [Chloroflexi bacterium TSY]|nr:DUF1670 domain-containing protein [Chloroflexi bacterium TSY]MBV7334732.1 DUF1670 domain-containing protein [Chloroflexi bacterium TSY]
MTRNPYVGTQKRTFQAAFIHEMETNYGFLKSRRMLNLLAQDIQQLVDEFYPVQEHLRPGWILFTGTKADNHKARPGQQACEFTSVTIPWPLLTPEDFDWMTTQPDTKEKRRQLLIQRTVRLIEHGQQHPQGPVLLTLADLASLLGMTPASVSNLLKEARQKTGKSLPTKGYFFDQGMRPTHKAQIIALYEQGLDEVEIARISSHAQSSVGHYLRDYERVKELIKSNITIDRIPRLLDMQPSVVHAYVELLRHYRPALFDSSTLDD